MQAAGPRPGTAGAASESTNVRVAVRVRPLVAKERMERARECIRVENPNSLVIGKDRRFTFDFVHGPDSKQESLYTDAVVPLVEGCLKGYNATVLAYGQTGSGKTYTMGSGSTTSLLEEQVGIIPRVIQDLFYHMHENKHEAEFLVRCSFLEIYNEEVRDLLHPDTDPKGIHIRERENGEIFVAGVREEVATSEEELARLLFRGSGARATGATLMNASSSRSHAIFTITLEQHSTAAASADAATDARPEFMMAKFHLVDLAGSERNKKTAAVGGRMKEGININCGLLALGNVISALGDESKRGGHVPYRESKLTRLLQDSLGGNSSTVMIACCSGADDNMEESLNTLKYANRARNIRNKPVVNRDPESAQLASMKDEIHALQQQLRMQQQAMAGGTVASSLANVHPDVLGGTANQRMMQELHSKMVGAHHGEDQDLAMRIQNYAGLEREVARLQGELARAHACIAELEADSLTLRSERDMYLQQIDDAHKQLHQLGAALDNLKANGQVDREAYPCLAELVDGARNSTATPPAANLSPVKSASNHQREVSLSANRAVPPGDGETRRLETHLSQIKNLETRLSMAQDKLQQNEDALGAAQEDLARDELIFAERVKEIKRLRRALQDAERDKENRETLFAQQIERLREDHQAELAAMRTRAVGGEEPEADEDAICLYSDDEEGSQGGVAESYLESEAAAEQNKRLEVQARNQDLETEKCRLEEVEMEQRRDFQLLKQQTERQLKDLTRNIEDKARLIEELSHNESQARALNAEYAFRMQQLEGDVAQKEAEMETLKMELENLESDKAKSEAEKKKMRDTYEERMRKMQVQVVSLKKQQQQQETSRLEKVRHKSEVKVSALETEITRMRLQSDLLKKRLKDNSDNYDDQCKNLAKEKATLMKEADARDKRIRELEAENQRQKVLLKRKETEVHAARRQAVVGGGESHAAGDPPTPGKAAGKSRPKTASVPDKQPEQVPEPADSKPRPATSAEGKHERPTTSRSKHRPGETGIPLPRTAVGGEDVGATYKELGACTPEQLRRWLGQEVMRMRGGGEAEHALQSRKEKLASLVKEREECVEKRANFELRQARALASLEEKIAASASQLDQLKANIQLTHSDRTLTPEEAAIRVEKLNAQVGKLKLERKQMLESKSRGCVLSAEDETDLREVDDRLDALDAEEEYVAAEISELQESVAFSQRTQEEMHKLGQHLAAADAATLFQVFAQQLATTRDHEDQEKQRVCALEENLNQQARRVEELSHALQQRELEHDAKTIQMEREHARKVQLLLGQINQMQDPSHADAPAGRTDKDLAEILALKEQQVQALDKDNFYYKQANRELKRRLRDLLTTSDADQLGVRMSVREMELMKLNSSLLGEVDNCREFMRRTGSSVRVSKRVVRELKPEQSQQGRPSSAMPVASLQFSEVTPERVASSQSGLPPRHNSAALRPSQNPTTLDSLDM